MTRQRLDTYAGVWTTGIDVSAYQTDVDWPVVARGSVRVHRAETGEVLHDLGPPRFCSVRLADGLQTRSNSDVDPLAVRHLTGAHEAGLLVAGYHYLRAYHDGAEQAELALEAIRVAGVPCPWVGIDLEYAGMAWAPYGQPSPSTEQGLETAEAYALRLIEAGLRPVVYTGQWWHEAVALKRIEVPPVLRVLDLWTAWYSSSATRYALPAAPPAKPWPWSHAEMWQCAGGGAGIEGRSPGIRGPIDVNRYRGDEAALRAWWIQGFAGVTQPTDPAPSAPLRAGIRVPVRAGIVHELERLAGEAKVGGDLEAAHELAHVIARLSR